MERIFRAFLMFSWNLVRLINQYICDAWYLKQTNRFVLRSFVFVSSFISSCCFVVCFFPVKSGSRENIKLTKARMFWGIYGGLSLYKIKTIQCVCEVFRAYFDSNVVSCQALLVWFQLWQIIYILDKWDSGSSWNSNKVRTFASTFSQT